mmetsp:Transcript_27049/g.67377  ORF Transcript_27049/g.67377 Transcript_27049/m.67377 type:complete len:207 (+) Transcript_27049:2344-2964(+)
MILHMCMDESSCRSSVLKCLRKAGRNRYAAIIALMEMKLMGPINQSWPTLAPVTPRMMMASAHTSIKPQKMGPATAAVLPSPCAFDEGTVLVVMSAEGAAAATAAASLHPPRTLTAPAPAATHRHCRGLPAPTAAAAGGGQPTFGGPSTNRHSSRRRAAEGPARGQDLHLPGPRVLLPRAAATATRAARDDCNGDGPRFRNQLVPF